MRFMSPVVNTFLAHNGLCSKEDSTDFEQFTQYGSHKLIKKKNLFRMRFTTHS